jgi:hypothetical protein
MQKALDKLALAISAITSPIIIISLFSFLIIKNSSGDLNKLALWGCSFILISVLIPTIFILYELKQREIGDFHIAIRSQRVKPFLFSLLCVLALLATFYLEHAPREIMIMSLAFLINGFIFFVITFFWKISIHLGSLSGSIALAVILVDPNFAYCYLLVPATIWARMRRHRHSIWQGTFAMVISSYITVLIFTFADLLN